MSEMEKVAMDVEVDAASDKVKEADKKAEAEKKSDSAAKKLVDKEIEEAKKKLAELPRKFKDKKEEAELKAKVREARRIKRIASHYSSNAIKSQLKTASGYYKECLMAELKRRSEK